MTISHLRLNSDIVSEVFHEDRVALWDTFDLFITKGQLPLPFKDVKKVNINITDNVSPFWRVKNFWQAHEAWQRVLCVRWMRIVLPV